MTKGYCLFTSVFLNSDRSAIFGLILFAFHGLQLKQYFPRLFSTFLDPIIRKVCCSLTFTCFTPWWPQSWCAFSTNRLVILLKWRTRECFVKKNSAALLSLPPTLKSPSLSRKVVKRIRISPFSRLLPFKNDEIVTEKNEKNTFWEIVMR